MNHAQEHIAAPPRSGPEIVFVTGLAGAGRSTAVKCLEDLGFEAIDNLPLSLLPRLLEGPPLSRPLALGVDVRNRDFSAEALIAILERIGRDQALHAELLFLDCRSDVLIQRYSETRRPHPLSRSDLPAQGIDREIDILAPVKDRATVLIDTSELTPHDLRTELQRWFERSGSGRLAVSVQSFSYKRGVPRGVDMVFDTRFLRNPHWDADLRARDGRDPAVVEFVASDERYEDFFAKVLDLCLILLPAFREEGKSYLTIAFGCTGGQHRSVAVAERLANALEEHGWQVSKRHRELERRRWDEAGGAPKDGDLT